MQKAPTAQTTGIQNCQKHENRSMKKKKENVVLDVVCLLVEEKMEGLCHTVWMLHQGFPFWIRRAEALSGAALRTIALAFFFVFFP